MEKRLPAILLVRLKPHLPNGAAVRESQRVCHLVPVPESGTAPEVLRAYCGTEITPGSAELVDGMPCEDCMAKSPFPAFAMLHMLAGGGDRESAYRAGRHQVGEWSDHGLTPEQRLAVRFVLLLLLQDPTQPMSASAIADRLRMDPDTVNLIVLLHVAVGWVQQWATPDPTDPARTERHCQLTEHGAILARRLLAHDLTSTFADLARGLGLDITVIPELNRAVEAGHDGPGPGGRSGTPGAAPTGSHPDPDDTENAGGGG